MIDTDALDQRPRRGLGRLTAVLGTDGCAVRGCPGSDAEATELVPLNPVDYSSVTVPLCGRHREWARKRNQLARALADELRDARQRVGSEYETAIAELAEPPRVAVGGVERPVETPPQAHARGE